MCLCAIQQETGEQGLVDTLLQRIQQREAQLAGTKQQLERVRQNSDREKLAQLTRLVEITAERDNLKAALAEAGRSTDTAATVAATQPVSFTLMASSSATSTAVESTSSSVESGNLAPASTSTRPQTSPPNSDTQITDSLFISPPNMQAATSSVPQRPTLPAAYRPVTHPPSPVRRAESSTHYPIPLSPPAYLTTVKTSRIAREDDDTDSENEILRPSKRVRTGFGIKAHPLTGKASSNHWQGSTFLTNAEAAARRNTAAGPSVSAKRKDDVSPYKDWQGKPWNNGVNPFASNTRREGVPLGITGVRSGLAGMTNDPFGAAEDKARCNNCQLIGRSRSLHLGAPMLPLTDILLSQVTLQSIAQAH